MSIAARQVFALCKQLFPEFTEDDHNISLALLNRRNEELHTGGAAFQDYPSRQWQAGFYRACRSLCEAMGESLSTLFGDEEAKVATDMVLENQKEVIQRVKTAIADHQKRFQAKADADREDAKKNAALLGLKLSTERHHRVDCPACQCVGTVQGTPFGREHVTHGDGEIVVRQSVSPTSFTCSACELKFQGYAELDAAGLGGQYTRRTTFSPEEYYGLIGPANLDDYLDEHGAAGEEYDNE